jgi:uncharacterized membrane protein
MTPALQIVSAVVGALIGANIGPGGGWFFSALVGAFAGYAVAEIARVRGRILALEQEIAGLRQARAPLHEAVPPEEFSPAPEAAPPQKSAADMQWEEEVPVAEAPPPLEQPRIALQESRREERSSGEPDMPIVRLVKGFFTGGNALVRAGVIILFFGVAFLLRYVAEHSHVPIEVRLAGVALGALVLLGFGWRLRKSRPGYALALQGGAVGILYLTIFAALRLYAVLPAPLAFVILVAVAGLSAALAVLQNSQAFALLAVTGGFLAPILASTGQGDHIVLFSYYAVLNAGMLGMAWFKAWRPLNLAGFVFTFVISTAWGVTRYRPEDFPTTEPFLILFFLFYVAVAVLFALRQGVNLKGYVDGPLVFGLPIIAFGLQSGMLHDRLFDLAFSAVAVSALYLTIAWSLHRRRSEAQRVLVEAFAALGVVFLTLAVPLALDGRWNAATWALEGSSLIWIGCRQARRLPRAFGLILTIAAGIVVAQEFDVTQGVPALKWGAYLSVLTLSAASMFSARTLQAHRSQLAGYEQVFAAAVFLWGLLWWSAGGSAEITQYMSGPYTAAAGLSFAALTALGSGALYRRIGLDVAKAAALLLLPVMALFAVDAMESLPHPLAHGGWIAWPASFAVFYLLARRLEGPPRGGLARALHVGSAWFLCAMLGWETAWAVNAAVRGGASWRAVAWAIVPMLALFFLPRLATRVEWPFRVHREAYLFTAGAGFAAFLGLWSLAVNFNQRGDAAPLPYVPLLNPLDIAQAFVFVILLRYRRLLRAAHVKAFAGLDPRLLPGVMGGLAFVWANGVLLRTLHQWGGVPFSLDSFAQSTLAQTAVSIFWAVLALSMMLMAARKSSRPVWLAGAVLLAVVVAKLFLVDLSRIGSIERIVSFVGVGLLMLIVGYLSPLPPAVEQRR